MHDPAPASAAGASAPEAAGPGPPARLLEHLDGEERASGAQAEENRGQAGAACDVGGRGDVAPHGPHAQEREPQGRERPVPARHLRHLERLPHAGVQAIASQGQVQREPRPAVLHELNRLRANPGPRVSQLPGLRGALPALHLAGALHPRQGAGEEAEPVLQPLGGEEASVRGQPSLRLHGLRAHEPGAAVPKRGAVYPGAGQRSERAPQPAAARGAREAGSHQTEPRGNRRLAV
mmetsp:Transcript_71713/g.123232  ORF Transcript_71713/g.123232 Transcript_71713/m.123232 type:complete len:235 (-) Transcript_71713:836-1540(-)